MVTVGVVLLSIGTCFLGVGPIFLVLRWSDAHLLRVLRRAARPTLGQLSSATSLPRRVLITARVAPGPDGLLTAPAYHTPCVWYRTTVSSHSGGDADGHVAHLGLSSGGPAIRVVDGTGAALVAVDLVLSSHDRVHRARSETMLLGRKHPARDGSGMAALERKELLPASTYPRFGTRSVHLAEVTVAAGIELSVVARPRRLPSGTVLFEGRGSVSARSAPEWVARLESDVASAGQLSWVMPAIGLAFTGVGLALAWAGAS